jgi:pimeloyl-ACP methyl ester carboxylesterase
VGKIIFLPGASGRRHFWAPVAERLPVGDEASLMGWPGFGDEPLDPGVRRLTDLAAWVAGRVSEPVDIVAQSMGGVVALLLALERPDIVRRLVLCGTSAGMDLTPFAAEDWRADYLTEYLPSLPERAPSWFADDRTDLTPRLGSITTPALLVWGADDRIVPPAAGKKLSELLPKARFVSIEGSSHAVGQEKPDMVAAHIAEFLGLAVGR